MNGQVQTDRGFTSSRHTQDDEICLTIVIDTDAIVTVHCIVNCTDTRRVAVPVNYTMAVADFVARRRLQLQL